MAQLSSLLPRILPHLPQATQPLVMQQLQDVVVDFFARTKVYQPTLSPIDTVVSQAEYAMTMPAGYVLVQVMNLQMKKQVVEEQSEDTLDLHWTELSKGYTFRLYHNYAFGGADQNNWRLAVADVAKFYFLDNEKRLRLVGMPTTAYTGADGLVAKVAVKPLPTVTEIPDDIYNDYYQILVDGALFRMMRVPSKPWTDKAASRDYEGRYEQGVADTEAEMNRSVIRNDRSVMHTKTWA